MKTKESVVAQLMASIDALDIDAVLELFTDDAVYRDVPVEPEGARGKDAIRFKLSVCFKELERMAMDVASIEEVNGRVYSERVETWHFRQGERVALPVLCVVEFDANNRIKHWREYWDAQTLFGQLPAYYLEYLGSLGSQ